MAREVNPLRLAVHFMREDQTEVFVVGAGPVGLFTALCLAEAGIEVRVIDRQARTTTRSYACALHPHTLELLDRVGLAAELVEQGRRVETFAFYDVRAGAPKPSYPVEPGRFLSFSSFPKIFSKRRSNDVSARRPASRWIGTTASTPSKAKAMR